MMRTFLLSSLVAMTAACNASNTTTPTSAGPVVDSLLTAPGRFAGVPGATGLYATVIKDTAGGTLAVSDSEVTWTIGDSAIAHAPVHHLDEWMITGEAPGTTSVTLSYKGRKSTIPVDVATAAFSGLAAGARTTCALDTSHRLYCWGFNLSRRVAQMFGQDFPGPLRPPVDVAFVALGLSVTHSCGLTATHVLECWGGNYYGERGDGSPAPDGTGIYTPTPVLGGHQFLSMSVGGGITCAIQTDSLAYCWGRNYSGELGNNDTALQGSPVAVSGGHHFASIATGGPNLNAMETHTCAIDGAGHLWCWGDNSAGQLGDSTTTGHWTPTEIDTGRTYQQVAINGGFTCALGTDGTAYCWGDGSAGQLGSDTAGATTPLAVPAPASFVAISAGETHVCGLTGAGALYCWGDNGHGELGRGTAGDGVHATPGLVIGGHTWTEVSVGMWHTCAKADDGLYYCWGGFGSETGNGLNSSGTPVAVMGQTAPAPTR